MSLLDVLIFVGAALLAEPIAAWLERLAKRWRRRP